MAPLILLLFLVPVILLLLGGLIYLGLKGIKAGNLKRILGALSLLLAGSIIVFLALTAVGLFNYKDNARAPFIGKYRAVTTTEEIELTIDQATYTLTPNSYSPCTSGTWEPALLDDGYAIEFTCPEGRTLGDLYLRNDQLMTSSGGLKFRRIE